MKYLEMLEAVVSANDQTTRHARTQVNQSLVMRNWVIGVHIVEFEQRGADRAAYGTQLLSQLAADLKSRGISGCSREMLYRMRQLFLVYPQLGVPSASGITSLFPGNGAILASQANSGPNLSMPMTNSAVEPLPPLAANLLLKLSWSHFIELTRIDDPLKRAFYENACLGEGWSVAELQRQVGSLLYERTGLSTDKASVIRHAREQAAAVGAGPSSIAEIMRDPYILEFTGLKASQSYLESDLERALLDHLQEFLLELGTGFCFEARQRRITLDNEHDYVDLVFYHRILRCHLLIDLKVRPFRHGDVGQMNFYLNWWKSNVTVDGDNLPVGLILCSDKSQAKVEYSTAGMDRQLFVSRYLVTLPQPDTLRRLLEEDRAFFEQRVELES